jgi:hypothetical protein
MNNVPRSPGDRTDASSTATGQTCRSEIVRGKTGPKFEGPVEECMRTLLEVEKSLPGASEKTTTSCAPRDH